MACDILLIDTLSTLRVEKGFISPSVETAQLSGFLEQEGFSFEVAFAVPRDDGRIDILQKNKVVAGAFPGLLQELSPRIIAFYHYPELVHLVFATQQAARAVLPECVFCVSGITCCALPQLYVDRGFQYVLGQDIYRSLVSLAKKILAGHPPPPGRYQVPHEPYDLDRFPFVSIKFYENAVPEWLFANGHVERFGLINASVGCTGGCAHCPNSSFWGTDWRPMSAGRIIDEIRFQMERLQVQTFYFGDINFFPNARQQNGTLVPHPQAVQRIRQLDRLLTDNGLEVKFITTTRPDTLSFLAEQEPALLDRYLSRFFAIFLGIESFSDETLSHLKNNITRSKIRTAIRELERKGVIIVASFLVGSPWDTWKTFQELEDFIMQELPASSIPLLNIMTPFPGTPFYNTMKKEARLLSDDICRFNGQHLLYRHPVFGQGELEERIQNFYFKFFNERYSG